MQPLIDAAKAVGLPDSVVLDHSNEAPYAGKVSSFDEYVAALRDSVYAAGASFAGRPLVLVGHSNGTVGMYGLARLLKHKARLLVVLGRRPPSTPLIPDALGVHTTAEVHAMSAHDLAQAFSTNYENVIMKGYTANPDESKWQPQIRAAVEMARAQYGSPCTLCAAEHITAAICAPGEPVPAAAKVLAPIVGIAAAKETPKGETAERMEAWRGLGANPDAFELTRDVDCAHMELPKHERTIALVVADDLGYADAGFTGAGGVAATPHLDALASAGVRLDRHYVQPICSPTRSGLM